MKTPITDAVATLIIMLALIFGGYLWLKSESDKIIQQRAKEAVTQKHEKSTLEKYAPKTFEVLSKRTE